MKKLSLVLALSLPICAEAVPVTWFGQDANAAAARADFNARMGTLGVHDFESVPIGDPVPPGLRFGDTTAIFLGLSGASSMTSQPNPDTGTHCLYKIGDSIIANFSTPIQSFGFTGLAFDQISQSFTRDGITSTTMRLYVGTASGGRFAHDLSVPFDFSDGNPLPVGTDWFWAFGDPDDYITDIVVSEDGGNILRGAIGFDDLVIGTFRVPETLPLGYAVAGLLMLVAVKGAKSWQEGGRPTGMESVRVSNVPSPQNKE